MIWANSKFNHIYLLAVLGGGGAVAPSPSHISKNHRGEQESRPLPAL